MSDIGGSSTSSHRSSALKTHTAQTDWREILRQHGVRDELAFTTRTRLFPEEEAARPMTVQMDDMEGWDAALESDNQVSI